MATVSRGTTSERYSFIQGNRKEFGVRYLCEWFQVSRSGYYEWVGRAESKRSRSDQVLTRQILGIYQASRTTYGSPRVHEGLKQGGVFVGRKRVARLMRRQNWRGRVVRVTRRQPGLKRFLAGGENLRRRGQPPSQANEAWVADITYLRVNGKWMYLAAIMDVYSRRIVGWSMAKTRTTALTLRALRQAMRGRRMIPGGVFHTDRGIEYRGVAYQERLKKWGIRPSVNRPGYCTDNAHMESFFHSLKAELVRGEQYRTEGQLRGALNGYINRFYNHRRIHSGIGYHSPAEFERITA